MSTIPAFVNAIFTLNKKGEFLLYEGNIEGGYTKVSITSKIASGYNSRYYKVKQIIAFEGQQAIVQSFDLPSQEFAYRMIEKAVTEKLYSQEGEDDGKIEVVTTGQQVETKQPTRVSQPNIIDPERIREDSSYSEHINNSTSTYKPVISSQSGEPGKSYSKGKGFVPDYNDASFNSLESFTGSSGFNDFSESGIKIANMSSFGNGQNSNRDRTKGNSLSALEDSIDW